MSNGTDVFVSDLTLRLEEQSPGGARVFMPTLLKAGVDALSNSKPHDRSFNDEMLNSLVATKCMVEADGQGEIPMPVSEKITLRPDGERVSDFIPLAYIYISRRFPTLSERFLKAVTEAAKNTPKNHGGPRNKLLRQIAQTKVSCGAIRFAHEPVNPSEIDMRSLIGTHSDGWPEGLAPPPEAIKLFAERDHTWVAWDTSVRLSHIVGAVHARYVDAGVPIQAHSVMWSGYMAVDLADPDSVSEPGYVLYAAVSRPEVRGAAVTQTLITESVLPYLEGRLGQEGSSKLARTSSPLTYMPNVGKKLVDSKHFATLSQTLAHYLGTHCDINQLICAADRHFCKSGLIVGHFDRGSDPSFTAYSAEFFRSLKTHEDLRNLRRGSVTEKDRAKCYEQTVMRLLHPADDDEQSVTDQKAAFAFIRLAAALTQSGIWSLDKLRPVDDVLGFHLGNGAKLDDSFAPIVGSRPEDYAALGLGQVFLYERDWEEKRDEYLRFCDSLRGIGNDGIYVNFDQARAFLANAVRIIAPRIP